MSTLQAYPEAYEPAFSMECGCVRHPAGHCVQHPAKCERTQVASGNALKGVSARRSLALVGPWAGCITRLDLC